MSKLTKRYYWLKMPEDFFQNAKIKKLRKVAGGDTYTIIYQKMLLLSIRNNGVLQFEGIENNFADEIALKLDENVEDVEFTLMFMQSNGLIEESESDESFLLPEAAENIGTRSESADRVSKFRQKQKNLETQDVVPALISNTMQGVTCNGDVTNSNAYIEKEIRDKSIEKEIREEESKTGDSARVKPKKPEKVQFAEFVAMTNVEQETLITKYGEHAVRRFIEILDNYKGSSGKKYKSDYRAILNWVVGRYEEEKAKNAQKSGTSFLDLDIGDWGEISDC